MGLQIYNQLIPPAMPLLTDNSVDRVMFFIDLQNVLMGSGAGPQFQLDLYRMVLDLAGHRRIMAAYVFDSTYVGDDSLKRLLDRLRYIGFRVVDRRSSELVNTDVRDSSSTRRAIQKEVDVALGCTMVVQAMKDSYDVAVVVSGDRDFVPAIEMVQDAGKRVEVASFEQNFSQALLRVADTYHKLDPMPIIRMDTRIEVPADTEEDTDVPVQEGSRWTSSSSGSSW